MTRRLLSIDEFAKLPDQQRDGQTCAISTASMLAPEFGESGRTITYTLSTPQVGRDNHTVAASAWQLDNFERNPVFLWFHDDSQPPIGRMIDIGNVGELLKGTVEYADRDLSPFADMIYRMVKARYINAVSTSWQPLAWNFSRDKDRPGGVDFSKVDLLEVSQVPVPALPAALAEARSNGIDTTPMVEWAERLLDTGGMILVPRTELETLRRASMSKTTKPTPAAAAAPSADDANQALRRALKTKHDRALRRAPKIPVFKRGLYDVANLCHMLCQLGYCHESSEYEAALEGDDSEVPEMLGEALVQLGECLKAMAAEEVDELLDAHEPGDDDDGDEEDLVRALPAKTRAHITAAKSPRTRAWRTAIAVARAAHELSPTNQDQLESASEHQERAIKHHKEMGEHHAAAAEHLTAAEDSHERATSTLTELGEHVRAAKANPAESADHLEKASKSHADASKHVEAVGDAHGDVADSQEDAADSHRAMGRCVKNAQRCVRSVIKGADTTEPDEPEADDLEDKEKAKAEKARRLRQATALKLRG